MSTRKSFDRVCIAVLIGSLLLTVLFMNGNALGLEAASRTRGYEARLFDTSKVHTLSIVIDDWDGFLENCKNEEYVACSVVVDNESYRNVGLRAKGNTSLSTVSSMNSNRYSLKLEFDHYETGKTYHGLDKLCLNNIIQDNTYMKDYLTYRMMNEFGVHAPLCSYVWITVNGEDWGLYLAVEGVEDAFLQRNYGADYGDLYKPDSQSFGGGGPGRGRDFRMSEFMENWNADSASTTASASPRRGGMFPNGFANGRFPGPPGGMTPPDSMTFPDDMTPPDGATMPANGADGGNFRPGGMRGMGSDDVKLKYVDDNPDSYGSIFENAKTDVTAADKARLIASLKALGEREDLESVVDIEQVLRYFVVHNYVVNGDSYTGSMIHNYYLYEKDGRLSMIPWDYNLAFGGFQGGSASGSVNDPIDTPLSVSGDGDRPMADCFLQQDDYTTLYHAYFNDFLDSVDVTALIDAAAALIADYVERDPTKFCAYDDFEKGVTALRTFCELRTQSVRGQLDGSIPSTDDGQSADNSASVDASSLTLSDMGNMGFGGGRRNRNADASPSDNADTSDAPAFPGGFDGSDNGFPGGFGGSDNGFPGGGLNSSNNNFPGNWTDASASSLPPTETWILLGVSVGVLLTGLLVVRLYRRRPFSA